MGFTVNMTDIAEAIHNDMWSRSDNEREILDFSVFNRIVLRHQIIRDRGTVRTKWIAFGGMPFIDKELIGNKLLVNIPMVRNYLRSMNRTVWVCGEGRGCGENVGGCE